MQNKSDKGDRIALLIGLAVVLAMLILYWIMN